MQRLGLEDWLRGHTVNHGLRAHGCGQTLLLPWPGGSLPDWGSAVARPELDDHLRTVAVESGAPGTEG
ncbi:MAG TPA: FAD-linked oxidoreductase, partial [Nocardioides sp.]|nr:FAD-linked oxidoreductase [Nocardioides sp.]